MKETGRRRSNCRLAEEDQTELRIEIFQTFKQLYFSSHPWQLLHTAIRPTCLIKSKFIKDSFLFSFSYAYMCVSVSAVNCC